jgi:membrane associated rhomboid family serine protease
VLIAIMTVMNLLPAISAIGQGDGIAHFAHLGGFLGGYLYLKWIQLRSPARSFRARRHAASSEAAMLHADCRPAAMVLDPS